MKSKPDVQWSRWRGWVGVALASATLGSQVLPGLALAAGNKTKAGVSAKPKTEVSAKPSAEASAKPKADAAAKGKAEAAAKPKADASAKGKAEASAKPGSEGSAQPATPVPAKAKGKPGPNPPQISPLVEACVDHHTDAQELRMAGKLVESRDALRQCAAEACPALLQRDCVGWLEQVEKQLPSISFRITVDGQSRSNVRVFVDGVRAREPESGRAVDLDPGAHELRVEYPGAAPFSERIVLSEGERYRLVEVSLTLPPQPPPKPEMHRPVPIMTYVLGSLGIAGAVSGGIWGASSLSLRQELEDSCAPACPERRVNELRQRALYTDVSLGIAAVSLLGATTLFVFRPEVPVEVDVSWLPDGGGIGNVRVQAF